MPQPDGSFMPDLRDIVEARLGKPLAASVLASLWRCPVCSPDMHSLLMVSAVEIRCLGRSICDDDVSERMKTHLMDDVLAGRETPWTATRR
jgi:hypothetical protein